jgi:hypothetical protein
MPFGNAVGEGFVNPGTVVASKVIIIGTKGELLVYSPAAGAGNLTNSIQGSAGTDQYNNNILAGTANYDNANGIATALANGFVAFYTGSLAGGWTPVSEVAGDVAGNLQVNAGGQLQLIGSGGVTINGSSSTGGADNGGVTSGPIGGVFANHTHAMSHGHPL